MVKTRLFNDLEDLNKFFHPDPNWTPDYIIISIQQLPDYSLMVWYK